MSEHNEQVVWELLALTGPDAEYQRIDREYVRSMLAEAWALGMSAALEWQADYNDVTDMPPVNPFRQ